VKRDDTIIVVVAALIESNGKILVCQRRRQGTFGLMWEFPGGKADPGEALQNALARELKEELGVTAKIGREAYRIQYRYAEMSQPIELIFYFAEINPQEARNIVFEKIEWVDPMMLGKLDFLPADRELIKLLADGKLDFRL